MTALDCMEKDIERYESLHSWYKIDRYATFYVYPFINFGQLPYQPIAPQQDPEMKLQLRWWFTDEPTQETFESIFSDSKLARKALKECLKHPVRLTGEFGSTYSHEHWKIKAQLMRACTKFDENTLELYRGLVK